MVELTQAEPCNVFAFPGTIAEYTRVAAEGTFDHDRSMYIGAHATRALHCVAKLQMAGTWLPQRCISSTCTGVWAPGVVVLKRRQRSAPSREAASLAAPSLCTLYGGCIQSGVKSC